MAVAGAFDDRLYGTRDARGWLATASWSYSSPPRKRSVAVVSSRPDMTVGSSELVGRSSAGGEIVSVAPAGRLRRPWVCGGGVRASTAPDAVLAGLAKSDVERLSKKRITSGTSRSGTTSSTGSPRWRRTTHCASQSKRIGASSSISASTSWARSAPSPPTPGTTGGARR